ncbi:MAG: 2-phosphosulfolactate phosphatase, partial [Desulfurococcales archaeon]|nr:2-phosphosulfolactate phosphatase [Desulfurococcales archaeon]
ADFNDALRAARELNAPLIAEVEGFKPEGADLDNSPTEVLRRFTGCPPEKLVIRTTSGALIIEEAVRRRLEEVLVGAVVNAEAVAKYLSGKGVGSVTIAMAGYKRSMFAIDDLLGAGAVIAELAKVTGDLELMTDEAVVARELYVKAVKERHIEELIKSGRAGRFLVETGRSADVEYSAKPSILPVVPKLRPGTRSITPA